jgi:NAD(P)-dependent dehydrogenase (short-subunit alcohol dehydrogenase family)
MVDESQTALITAGTSGIGRATAIKLARLGIHVIVVGRTDERGEKQLRRFGPPAEKGGLLCE